MKRKYLLLYCVLINVNIVHPMVANITHLRLTEDQLPFFVLDWKLKEERKAVEQRESLYEKHAATLGTQPTANLLMGLAGNSDPSELGKNTLTSEGYDDFIRHQKVISQSRTSGTEVGGQGRFVDLGYLEDILKDDVGNAAYERLINDRADWIRNKTVLELGNGLGNEVRSAVNPSFYRECRLLDMHNTYFYPRYI